MSLPLLNFPAIKARFKKNEKGTIQIFDSIRNKFVDLTPEEWVRQHVIYFFVDELKTPASKIAVEKQLKLNNTIKRTDIVIYDLGIKPLVIIECKAPNVDINQATINQALNYNLTLNVPYLFLTNGNSHVFLENLNGIFSVNKQIPSYNNLITKINTINN